MSEPTGHPSTGEATSARQATLPRLREALEEEEAVYGELLATLDRLSANPAPFDRDRDVAERLRALNDAPALSAPEAGERPERGLRAAARRVVRRLVDPELASLRRAVEHQRAFDSALVQFLNRFAETVNQAAARQAEFASALVGFVQRIDRLTDAKDRLYASLGSSRTDLLLEAMDKRLETVRLGLARAQAEIEGTATGLVLARAELESLKPEAPRRRTALVEKATGERVESASGLASAFEPEHYVAFENRFRGDPDTLRVRLRGYVRYFEGRSPVVDLGCGRGEFLELLQEAGIEARGVDGNEEMVQRCRSRGLEAEVSDLFQHLAGRETEGTGGVFACQVIEHLPPGRIRELVAESHRVLRPGGRIVLETVNPRSVVALVETFYRDLTHERPIHPETLDFVLRAAGFREVETLYRSPVSERARLVPVPGGPSTSALNQNFEKLNALLFGDQDYACVATK